MIYKYLGLILFKIILKIVKFTFPPFLSISFYQTIVVLEYWSYYFKFLSKIWMYDNVMMITRLSQRLDDDTEKNS